jgi:uncharacterized protein
MAVNRHQATHLDASAPLVLDTREVGRRPGTMRTVSRSVGAPSRTGLDLIAVLEGGELELDLRMESVVEGVLVSGTVTAEASGECSRCLEPLHQSVQVHLTELYAYPNSATVKTTEEDEVRRVQDDLIDLTEAVTEAIALELPLQPLCSEECAGLCAECGVRLAIAAPGHGHETIDPRWAALSAKFDGPSTENSTEDGALTSIEEK